MQLLSMGTDVCATRLREAGHKVPLSWQVLGSPFGMHHAESSLSECTERPTTGNCWVHSGTVCFRKKVLPPETWQRSEMGAVGGGSQRVDSIDGYSAGRVQAQHGMA